MSNRPTPSDHARETLKALAARKIAPTPDNYARMYHEISGAPAEEAAGKSGIVPAWSALIRDLLRQIETPHKGIAITHKKEGVETVLTRFAKDPEVLYEKLRGLMHSWSGAPTGPSPGELVPPPTPNQPAKAGAAPIAAAAVDVQPELLALMNQLRELLALALESTLASQPEMETDIRKLAVLARAATGPRELDELEKQLRQFCYKLEMRGGDQARIHEGLVRLLRLLVENVSEMVEDDKWLHGQVTALQEIVAKPLDRRAIADAERSLRDAVIKQGMLKQSLSEAKSTLRSLMATFIDRLGELTASTGEYHNKIEAYSQKIGKADNIAELGHILKDVMQDTRVIQASALRSHEEMLIHKKQADEAESKIRELEKELEQISELVREDQLTGALNRRGLDETLERELKRSERSKAPVSIALLDIDNFKRLNDTHGHQTGDLALKHLTKVVKETLRPADTVGRYGGEEFLIVLPDTGLDDALEVIRRLQRDLTKQFFLHRNERLLITFSAGVALRNNDEEADDLIARADKAMYRAKRAGKNRVEAAI